MSDILRQKLMVLFVSITLLFAFIGFLVLNQSLAWFSENKEVTADGLSVNAKVSPNLIIAKTVDEIQSEGVQFAVNFNGTARTNMIAVTHDSAISDAQRTETKHPHIGICVNQQQRIRAIEQSQS